MPTEKNDGGMKINFEKAIGWIDKMPAGKNSGPMITR
jgi:hypothetical protein